MKKSYIASLAAASLFLAGALFFHFQYAFYGLLKIVVTASCAYCGIVRRERAWERFLFFAFAAVYNPFFPVKLQKEAWMNVNAATLVFFAVSLFLAFRDAEKSRTEPSDHDRTSLD